MTMTTIWINKHYNGGLQMKGRHLFLKRLSILLQTPKRFDRNAKAFLFAPFYAYFANLNQVNLYL